jgi:site-specific recombinase XerD
MTWIERTAYPRLPRAGRHTFATALVCGGTDLVVVADLLGHTRLDTVHAYTRPTEDDRTKALNLLPTDC